MSLARASSIGWGAAAAGAGEGPPAGDGEVLVAAGVAAGGVPPTGCPASSTRDSAFDWACGGGIGMAAAGAVKPPDLAGGPVGARGDPGVAPVSAGAAGV